MAIARRSLGKPVSVLVFTPVPTHPPTQGNRHRVFDMCRAMQSIGAELTVLHYATEGLGASDARGMRELWGDVEVVFPRGFAPKQSLARYPAIDDWFDPAIGEAAARLGAERRFDVCVANYAWYSAIFEYLPETVVRIIDTHDVFGGRAERFAEINIAPEWFHTSVTQEQIGLDRADFVVAIQDMEAETLRLRTTAQVRSIGFLSEPNFLAVSDRSTGRRLRVGYVGSGNPFNVFSILAFARAWLARPEAADQFEVHIAGPICAALAAIPHPFVAHGVVDMLAEFYQSIDVAINPMLGGTGLKIKSLEALSFGKPLVATSDSMVGIDSDHEGHQLRDGDQIVKRLCDLSQQPEQLAREAAISQKVFRRYRESQLQAFLDFWSKVQSEVAHRTPIKADRAAGAHR